MTAKKDKVRTFFNIHSREYDLDYDPKNTGYISYVYKLRKKIVLDMIKETNGKQLRILEVGCGPAVVSNEILDMGHSLYGIDISEKMVKLAKLNVSKNRCSKKARFKRGDIESLDFPDSFFDCVIAIGVLPYLKDDKKALKEIHRVLKPEGIAVVSFGNRFSPNYWTRYSVNKISNILRISSLIKKKRLVFQDFVLRSLTPKKIKKELAESGFMILDYDNCGYKLFPFHKIFPWFFGLMEHKLRGYSKSRVGYLATEQVLKIVKSV